MYGWMVLLACGGGVDTESTDTDEVVDARYDRDTWPESLDIGGREVPVWGPSDYDASEGALPVLVSLHGYSGNGALQDLYWGSSDYVDTGRFVLAVPDGTVDGGGFQFWNATDVCCNWYGSTVDDEAFLIDLLDEIEGTFPVDTDRVYFAGHSNGGFMSYRMACTHADRITAIASLAGSGYSEAELCEPSEPVSILQIHGTADGTVAYEDDWAPGAETMVARWEDRDGCTGASESLGTLDLDDNVAGEETVITRTSSCDEAATVELWTLEGSGHIPALTDDWMPELWGWLSAQ